MEHQHHRRVWSRGAALGALAVAIAAGATSAALDGGSHQTTARIEARRLLTLVNLPPGTQPSSRPPAGAGAALSLPASIPSAPHLVDLSRYFVATGTPAAVIGYVDRHRPRGAGQGGYGDGPGGPWTSFEFGPVGNALRLRELTLGTVALKSGGTGIRVDSQVAPLPVLPGTGSGPGALRVVEQGTELGSFGFELSCDPAGGTLPDPSEVCARIVANPALLYSFPGPDHSCPYGGPSISLEGMWDHSPLRSSFSVCTGGQEQQASNWGNLLPSLKTEGTVTGDRAIGLVHLGEDEAAAVDLLRGVHGAPPACESCTRSFDEPGVIGYGRGPNERLGWTIGLTHGRVSEIVADGSELNVDGAIASRGFASLKRALRGWRVKICPHTQELMHTSAAGATTIVYGDAFRRVIVTAPGHSPGCS